MLKVEVLTYMVRTGSASKKVTGTSLFTDKHTRKPTTRWAKALIEKYFPEFVIGETLIILCRTYYGFQAARSCTQAEIGNGFAFKYLEITTTEEPVAAPSAAA